MVKPRKAMVIWFTAWTGDPKKSEETTVWEDNWDDDIVDDEFTHQLR